MQSARLSLIAATESDRKRERNREREIDIYIYIYIYIYRWRDDLDKYWSDTIWQRKAQDRVVWRQHAEAFAQPRDTTAA